MKYKIEPISKSDEQEALQILTVSFVNDPSIVFFSPDAAKRLSHTMRMVRSISGILQIFGKKYAIKDNGKIVAVAMWIPPGKSIHNWLLIKAGFFLIPFIMGLRVFQRVIKFLDIASIIQEEHMVHREHWHLFYIAVHPAYQQQGYGSAIISNILAEADQSNTPVFVQAFTQAGAKFLGKNGFQVVSKTKFSKDCIMICLIREPNQKKTGRLKPDVKKSVPVRKTTKSPKPEKPAKAVKVKKTKNETKKRGKKK